MPKKIKPFVMYAVVRKDANKPDLDEKFLPTLKRAKEVRQLWVYPSPSEFRIAKVKVSEIK